VSGPGTATFSTFETYPDAWGTASMGPNSDEGTDSK